MLVWLERAAMTWAGSLRAMVEREFVEARRQRGARSLEDDVPIVPIRLGPRVEPAPANPRRRIVRRDA